MSKRLQILLPEEELKALQKVSKLKHKSVAQVVRESIRTYLTEEKPSDPEKKISRLLRFSHYEGPTGDIQKILKEIEEGRNK